MTPAVYTENKPPPFRFILKVKNNRLWTAIMKTFPAVRSQNEAAQVLGLRATQLGTLLNIRRFPGRIKPDGIYWNEEALKISAALHVEPEFLFDPHHYGRKARTVIKEVASLEDVPLLAAPEQLLGAELDAEYIKKQLIFLNPRAEQVVRKHHGIDCDRLPFHEIGEQFAVTIERARQIYMKALSDLPGEVVSMLTGDPLLEEGKCKHPVLFRASARHICCLCKDMFDHDSRKLVGKHVIARERRRLWEAEQN